MGWENRLKKKDLELKNTANQTTALRVLNSNLQSKNRDLDRTNKCLKLQISSVDPGHNNQPDPIRQQHIPDQTNQQHTPDQIKIAELESQINKLRIDSLESLVINLARKMNEKADSQSQNKPEALSQHHRCPCLPYLLTGMNPHPMAPNPAFNPAFNPTFNPNHPPTHPLQHLYNTRPPIHQQWYQQPWNPYIPPFGNPTDGFSAQQGHAAYQHPPTNKKQRKNQKRQQQHKAQTSTLPPRFDRERQNSEDAPSMSSDIQQPPATPSNNHSSPSQQRSPNLEDAAPETLDSPMKDSQLPQQQPNDDSITPRRQSKRMKEVPIQQPTCSPERLLLEDSIQDASTEHLPDESAWDLDAPLDLSLVRTPEASSTQREAPENRTTTPTQSSFLAQAPPYMESR